MGNKKRMLLKGLLLCVCFIGIGMKGSRVQAEEVENIKEGTGDLEELRAIRLSDEEIEEWEEVVSIQNANAPVSEEVKRFLECGSDYGYRDMLKRSNSAGRQYAYRKIEELSRAFTVDGTTATEYKLNGSDEVYFAIGTIDLTGYEMQAREMLEAYFIFRDDNPQYFWLSNCVLYGWNKMIVLTYEEYKDGEIRQDVLEEIMHTLQNVYKSKISSGDTNYQKVLKIHDALITDVEYTEDINISAAHSIAGAMTSAKTAVCEGYAKVMQVMMNYYNITNIYVSGTMNCGGHAWNLVRMNDGKYYWLDATWDDRFSEEIQHKYFLVGNKNFPDHNYDLPTNPGAAFLYDLPIASDENYVYDPDNQKLVKGDINEDGTTNLFDSMLCLNHVARKNTLEGVAFLAADVDTDGKVDLFDLMRILNYVAKKSDVV